MSYSRHEWCLQIELTVPFNTSGLESGPSELDTTMLRDHNGKLILSGYQILGHFRHFLRQVVIEQDKQPKDSARGRLITSKQFLSWFGKENRQLGSVGDQDDDTQGEGHSIEEPLPLTEPSERATLVIRDLVCITQGQAFLGERTRTRISIDNLTGAVSPGAYQVIEQPFEPGRIVSFGHLQDTNEPAAIYLVGNEADARSFEVAFNAFQKGLIALGANKGQGFGRVRNVTLQRRAAVPVQLSEGGSSESESFAQLLLMFDGPILVDPALMSGNLYRSAREVPGSVIKAALAELIHKVGSQVEKDRLLCALTAVRIGHVKPQNGARPYIPANIVAMTTDEGETLKDYFSLPAGNDIPLFKANFKPRHTMAVNDLLGGEAARFVSRTRTAIEPNLNTAKEKYLYTYQALVAPNGFLMDLAWPEDLAREAQSLIELLGSGNIFIGKLRTRLTSATKNQTRAPTAQMERFDSSYWRVQLATPAYLIDIETGLALRNEPGQDLRDVYRDIFKSQLGEDVVDLFDWNEFDCLVSHFWAGGHRAVRYKREFNGEKRYYPYMLTEPGSVFRLKIARDLTPVQKAKTEQALSNLIRDGLKSAGEHLGWEHCPYIRNNGYGEINVEPVADALIYGREVDFA